MIEIVSQEYRQQLYHVHRTIFWGASGYSHAATVADYAEKLGAKTILDFGCGRATLKPTLLKINKLLNISEYDPGIPELDVLPQSVDLLVANDVLEHIEY